MRAIAALLAVGLSAAVGLGQVGVTRVVERPPAPQTQPARQPRPSAERSARRLLDIRLPTVRFQDVPLSQALEQLAKMADVNIVTLWRHLEAVGVERTTPVTLQLRNLRLRTVLWLLLEEAAGPGVTLAYSAGGDLILISTEAYFHEQTVLRIYDVTDLVAAQIRHPTAVVEQTSEYIDSFEPVVGSGAALARPIIGRLRSGTFMQSFREVDDDFSERGRQRRMRELIELIVNTVAPESWNVNGGPGVIWPYRNYLIVRNSPLVHQQLGGPPEEPGD